MYAIEHWLVARNKSIVANRVIIFDCRVGKLCSFYGDFNGNQHAIGGSERVNFGSVHVSHHFHRLQ